MFKRPFNPVYLLIIIFPLVYFLLPQVNPPKENKIVMPNFFSFSAKTTETVQMTLSDDTKEFAAWTLHVGGFKILNNIGPIIHDKPLFLKIEGLNKKDSIFFLSFNTFLDNKLRSNYTITSEENITFVDEHHCMGVSPLDDSKTIKLTLKPLNKWESKNSKGRFIFFIELIFLVVIVLLHILAPSREYFIIVCAVSLVVLLAGRAVEQSNLGIFKLHSSSQLIKGDIFYNSHPLFSQLKQISHFGATHSFEAEVDFEENNFIRFDVDGVNELNDLEISAQYGWFTTTWHLNELGPEKLIINDLNFKNGVFYITGIDPFIIPASDYFQDDIRWLIFLKNNTFFFISILVFIILICLHPLLSRFTRFRFKPVYLLFLALPVAYYFLHNNFSEGKKGTPTQADKGFLYFSAKSTAPAVISLYATNDSITSWYLKAGVYKILDCPYRIGDAPILSLRVNYLSPVDTISFTAFNYYQDDTLYSMYNRSYPYCGIENAGSKVSQGIFSVTPTQAGIPATLNLSPPNSWHTLPIGGHTYYLVSALFLLAFIIVILWAPNKGYFLTSCTLMLLILFLLAWIGADIQDHITIQTSTAQRSVETYFSQTPKFNNDDKFPSKIWRHSFNTQAELGKHAFIRCDLDDSLKVVRNLKITAKTGLLHKEWNFSEISPGNLIMNDVDFHNGKFIIQGNDPFFALTSTYFVHSLLELREHRFNAFVYISILIFILLIILQPYTSHIKKRSFFLLVFFLIVLFSGLIYRLFNSERVRLITEKRDAGTLPIFNSDSIIKFTTELSAYLDDQVTGRNRIIPLNNYMYYSLFGQLLNNPEVYFGKNEWMYYIGANGRETYENRVPITPIELTSIKNLFEERRDWLAKRGIKLYIIFPRISQFIYEEHLGPRMFRYNKVSKLDQLTTYLQEQSDLNIIDVGTPLLEAKKNTNAALYYKSSTHWTFYGAYYGYEALMNRIYKDFPEAGRPIRLEDIEWHTSVDLKKDIDLIEMAALTGYLRGYELQPHHPDLFAGDTTDRLFPEGRPDFPTLYIQNNKKQGPNMMMFRDSYARQLIPYITHHFHNSAFLWTNTLMTSLVENEKPDLVIWEMSERFIPFFLMYKNPPFSEQDESQAARDNMKKYIKSFE